MPASSRTPVLIVGAGPAGATMAAELARYGVACRLVDKAPGPTDQSRALGLQTRTLELLHRLTGPEGSVGQAVAGEARVMHGFKVYGAGGECIAELALGIDPAESRCPDPMVLPQSRTQELLLAHLEAVGRAVEFGTALVELEMQPDGARALVRRTDGTEEWIAADWVIGADGAGSLVRRVIGANFIGAQYEEKFLLADVRVRWPLSDEHGHIFLRPGGPILAFPFPDRGRWRLIDTSDKAETGEPAPTVERFRRLFSEQVADVVIDEPGWTSLFRINRRLVERYRVGRAFLMGDAAHIHSPASGQGLNTGVQDAVNLAWKLALVVEGAAPDALLDSYRAERRPVAEGVLSDSHRITEAVLARNPVVQHVRDWAVGFALGFDSVQHRLARGLSKIGANYRQSSIVPEKARRSGDGPRAGDRMPDPVLDANERLSDRLNDAPLAHHLLVLAGERAGEAGDAAEAARQMILSRGLGNRIAVHLFPREAAGNEGRSMQTGTLHGAFGIGRSGGLVLVRPDLYIAFRGDASEIAGLGRALDLVFLSVPTSAPARDGTSRVLARAESKV